MSGFQERKAEAKGLKQTSVLTAEQYRVKEDPKENVFVQRTWLYGNDPVTLLPRLWITAMTTSIKPVREQAPNNITF
jgi:hypothetical protein